MTDWLAQVKERYVLGALFLGVVLVATLVNRFSRGRRKHVGRMVILFVLSVIFEAASAVALHSGSESWASRLDFFADLFESFVLINIVVITIFDLIVPAVAVTVPLIVSDLLIGGLYVVATLGTLHAAGVNASSVVGASAVVSAVLALSLQSTLGNVIGGVALQLDGSVHVGDWIQLENGRQGKVKEIHWRHTVLETRDWGTLIVPNSTLLQSQILVLAKREGQPKQHRYWVYFNVDFRHSPSHVIAAVNQALQEGPIPNVASEPKPHCICYDFAREAGRDSFAYYAVRYWLTDLAVDDPTNSVVRQRVFMALKRAGIPLAKPSQTVFTAPDETAESRRDRHRARRVDALRHMALFADLTDEEREYLSGHLVYAPFIAGELVTKRGKVAHWLYIVFSGSVDVQITDDGVTKVLSTINAPGFFGEMGMMTGESRTADVVAKTDVECYRLDKEGFQKVILARPGLAKAMSATMAERRAELMAVRDGMAADQKARFKEEEEARILQRVEAFFGLA